MVQIGEPDNTVATTTTSSTWTTPSGGCSNRLPCGICRLMMVQCPKMGYINTTWCGPGMTVGKVDAEASSELR